MKLDALIEEMKVELLACGLLESELEDAQLKLIVKKEMRELERYWDETTKKTIPAKSCIDLKEVGIDACSIKHVYRATGYGNGGENLNNVDPVWAQQWLVFGNLGNMYNVQDYVYNYAAWNTMSQIRNTMSTDLRFDEDRHNNLLYINEVSCPTAVTVEYIPRIKDVEDIKSVYWIDILVQLCVAMCKINFGRARTRFTLSNGLWPMDGEKLLQEGNEELSKLREKLETNDSLCDPID